MKTSTQRRRRAGLAGLLLAFFLCAQVFGQAGTPGAIFDFGAGARPLAMGGAYSAMTREASSLYYNPSGLSLLGGRNLSLMHATLFEGMSYDYLGYAQNYRSLPGGWGLQALRLAAGSADGRDEFNQPTADFTYSETALGLGTGIHGLFLPALSLGASIKVLNRSLADETNNLIGFDLGAQYGPLLRDKLRLSVVARNFGSFSTGDTDDKLPFGLKFGAAYSLGANISVCADISDNGSFQFGTEYGMGPGALRLGYDRDAFSFGGGLKFLKAYQLDYAMLKHPVLGLSNRLSMSYFFGKAVTAPPKVRVYAPDYIQRAETAIRLRDYVAALEAVSMAIGMDPAVRKGPWGEKFRRLEAVVAGLKLLDMPSRQKQLKEAGPQPEEAGRAVYEYLEGYNDKSSLLAHSALGYQPGSAFYSEFLVAMTGLTHTELNQDEILPRGALIKEKLRKSEAYFQMSGYDLAAKECEKVLLIDEGNGLAWTRLGSAYFAMGDVQRSRQAFLKARQLDPANQSVRDFILLQGWTP